VEMKFVDDLIIYLDYKIREAERIRNERKQLSFWWANSKIRSMLGMSTGKSYIENPCRI
jgi:hypothetical protein